MKKELTEEQRVKKNQQSLAWYYANKSNPDFLEYTRQKTKNYYNSFSEEQRKKHNERNKIYKNKNKEKFAGYERKRRAVKRNSQHERYTVEEVLTKYGNICYICNEKIDLNASRRTGIKNWKKGLQIDHFIPIAKGGADTLENARPSHGLCNLSRGTKEVITEVAQNAS